MTSLLGMVAAAAVVVGLSAFGRAPVVMDITYQTICQTYAPSTGGSADGFCNYTQENGQCAAARIFLAFNVPPGIPIPMPPGNYGYSSPVAVGMELDKCTTPTLHMHWANAFISGRFLTYHNANFGQGIISGSHTAVSSFVVDGAPQWTETYPPSPQNYPRNVPAFGSTNGARSWGRMDSAMMFNVSTLRTDVYASCSIVGLAPGGVTAGLQGDLESRTWTFSHDLDCPQ